MTKYSEWLVLWHQWWVIRHILRALEDTTVWQFKSGVFHLRSRTLGADTSHPHHALSEFLTHRIHKPSKTLRFTPQSFGEIGQVSIMTWINTNPSRRTSQCQTLAYLFHWHVTMIPGEMYDYHHCTGRKQWRREVKSFVDTPRHWVP